MSSRDPYILMLAHDQDDQQLTLSIVEELGLALSLRFVAGPAALYDAIGEQEPMLVLLDFNTKPETGLEILTHIRSTAAWRHIPVVLLGETRDSDFVKRCYGSGASSYVVKPSSLAETRRVIADFFTYWQQIAETPAHSTQTKPVAS